MKYWGLLGGKLLTGGGLLVGLWPVFRWLLPKPWAFVNLGYTLGCWMYGMAAIGLIYLIIQDQRYRCRTCLRKLRMPITRGSWGRMLESGRPHVEYICPFGHGTLKVPQLQISGKEPIDWAEHEDIWKELELLETGKR